MSSPSRAVVLSAKARQDFIDILRYTGERWGEAQLVVYRDKIDAALQALGRNADVGRHSDDLPATLRIYVVGSHVVIYRTDATTVGVVRILHQRMQLSNHSPKH